MEFEKVTIINVDNPSSPVEGVVLDKPNESKKVVHIESSGSRLEFFLNDTSKEWTTNALGMQLKIIT